MAFRAPIKVCFSDIDNAGIVYYPRFVHYFHLAIEEFFSAVLKVDYADVLHKEKVSFPTVHLESDFRSRLKYGDRIGMEVRVVNIGKSSITWGYRGFYSEGEKDKVVVAEEYEDVLGNVSLRNKELKLPKPPGEF